MIEQAASPVASKSAPRRHISITRGIGRTLLISFLGMALLPLIIFGMISLSQAYVSLSDSTQARQVNVADLREQTVRDWLDERKQDLLSLRQDAQTEDWIHSILYAADSTTLKALLTERLEHEAAQGGGFKRLFLINAQGLSVVSSDPRLVDKSHQGQPFAAPTTDQPISVLYYDNILDDSEVAVAQGIFDSNHQLIGVLVGTTDLTRLAAIMQSGTRMGQSDESYLISDDYRFLTAPSHTAMPVSGKTEGVAAAFASSTGQAQGIFNDYNGNQVFGIYRVLPELGRVVLATEQTTSEVLAPIVAQSRSVLFMLLASITVSLVVAYILTRRIVTPIDVLTETAEKVTAGDLDLQVAVNRRDQLGSLANSFNAMTSRLRDLIDSLETRVEMRTAQVQASADVGRAATSILDPDQLLQEVVQLISDRFGFYYAAAFTLDASQEWAVLREAAGPSNVAWLLKQAGHRLGLSGNSMVAAAIREHQARIALDTDSEAIRYANPLLPDTRSEVALPLRVGDQILGVLDVQSTQAAAFDETSTALLQSMADQIAVALNNAAQYRREQTRAQHTAGLLAASLELTTQTDPAQVFQRIVQLAGALFDCDGASLWFPVEDNQIELQFTLNVGTADMTGRRLRIGDGLSGQVFETSATLRIDDYQTWTGQSSTFADAPFQAALGVPFITQGQPSGVLALTRSQPGLPFSPDDENAAQLFAAQAAAAIENTRLLAQVQTTLSELSLANRRLTAEAWQKRLRASEITYQHQRMNLREEMLPTLSVTLPIELRGQPIGQVIVEDDQPQRQLNADEVELVQEVVRRMALALEGARLFEQTQLALGEARRLAQRERLINRITNRLRGAVTVDEVLHIAADEMRHSLQAAYTAVELIPPTGNGDGQGDDYDGQ